MTTRQTIVRDERNPVDHLNSGYEGNNIPEDFNIPSCGLEDIDMAVHRLFSEEIGFQTRTIEGATSKISFKKPFVLFATGERFALAKRLRPTKDKSGALILPSISIRRTSTQQTSEDITGRGMNQSTGEMVIKRKLDRSDRDYQNFINKLALENMNLPSTTKDTGEYGPRNHAGTQQGALLDPHLGNDNVWEIITIPQPQFWTQTYEITFWTNYTEHMNYMVETLFSSFLPQGKMFKLTTDKGYWFIGHVDDQLQSGENFDDFTEKDRLVRYSFTMNVKSFLLAVNGPGNKVPVRRYLSAPTVSFNLIETQDQVYDEKQEFSGVQKSNFILTDIDSSSATAQEKTTLQKVLVNKEVMNPKTGKMEIKKVRILESNQKSGETVYYANVESLEDFIILLK